LTKTTLVFGRNYTKPNQIETFALAPNRIGALTPGRKSSIRRKQDGNEDALARVVTQNREELLLIADSHFGSLAADAAVSQFEHCFSRTSGKPLSRLLAAHFLTD
jgi:hypothetical protein